MIFGGWFPAISAACCVTAFFAGADPVRCIVDFRDGGGRKEAEILTESADGIEIQVAAAAAASHTQFIRWDQIRSISGDSAAPTRARRLETGEALWRGRTRLARGDLKGARECFVAAAQGIEPDAQLSRMMAAEGIAQTASAASGDWARSLEAAVTVSILRGRIGLPEVWMTGTDPVDHTGGLIFSVAPAWMDGDSAKTALEILVAAADQARRDNDLGLAQIKSDAARIAAADAGLPQPPTATVRDAKIAQPDSAHAENRAPVTNATRAAAKNGARLLSVWADAVSADAAARKRSRQSLSQMIRSEDGMFRVWAIYAEGRSLAMESDPDEVRRGVGKMLLIPAAYGLEMPRLAEAALAQSAIALARIQDDESAAILRRIQGEYEAEFSERIEAKQDIQEGD